jgi:hypothetical protein
VPRDLFFACAVACVLGPFFAMALEQAWTTRNANIIAIKAQLEDMR